MIRHNKFLLNLPIIVVELLTLLLVSYIGYGEVKRKYPRFQVQKMATQGEIIRDPLEAFLQGGFPIKQFGGFKHNSETLRLSDADIEQINVINDKQEVIFIKRASQNASPREYTISPLADDNIFVKQGYRVKESNESYVVSLPLTGKFGQVGYINIESNKHSASQVIDKRFESAFKLCIIIFILFSTFVLLYSRMALKNEWIARQQRNALSIVYLISFISMSGCIAFFVYNVFETGARLQTKALSDSMAHRIESVLDLGIQLDDVVGIDDIFRNYKENNPDINSIALTEDGISIYHTDTTVVGKIYVKPRDNYEYLVPLEGTSAYRFHVAVTIPVSIVRDAIFERAPAFIVLFIACGLISWIFLDAGTGLLQVRDNHAGRDGDKMPTLMAEQYLQGLRLIKPAYFLIVFTGALSISFLPQLVTHMAAEADSSVASASLPFTIYYALFAAVLIPAGHYAEKGRSRDRLKRLMVAGFLSEVIGLSLIALSHEYWLLTGGRAVSGIGQGLFLIGLQSYTLSVTPEDKRTQGAAVKVIGRNAGLISGSAIGALLYAYMDYHSLFVIASSLSLIGMIYLWALVPNVQDIVGETAPQPAEKMVSKVSLTANIVAVLRDGEFMKTLLLIGGIGKIAIAGVVMFAMPLILTEMGFATEDIGQALMLYYISSIIITHYASRIVDYLGTARIVLFMSAIVGGIAMILIGSIGSSQWQGEALFPGFIALKSCVVFFNQYIGQFNIPELRTYILLLSLVVAGISNGLLAAPIVTHISNTIVAKRCGNQQVSAAYVFLERGGHVVGPMVISQMLVLTGQDTIAIVMFGFITVVFGLVFLAIPSTLQRHVPPPPKMRLIEPEREAYPFPSRQKIDDHVAPHV